MKWKLCNGAAPTRSKSVYTPKQITVSVATKFLPKRSTLRAPRLYPRELLGNPIFCTHRKNTINVFILSILRIIKIYIVSSHRLSQSVRDGWVKTYWFPCIAHRRTSLCNRPCRKRTFSERYLLQSNFATLIPSEDTATKRPHRAFITPNLWSQDFPLSF